MSLNANLIKELREKSGAGIVDCKNALLQNDNDLDKAIALGLENSNVHFNRGLSKY